MKSLRWLLLILVLTGAVEAAQAQPDRKVIIVPGILGSELKTSSGNVVWGRLNSLNFQNFSQLNLLPGSGETVVLIPTDALRKIPLLFGVFSLGIYSELIDFLVGQSGGQVIGDYVEGETLFVFPYDWRRSNFANARLLNSFISEKVPGGERFDIVAHSMGGLITRIFLSDIRPTDSCVSSSVSLEINATDLDRLCTAVYGDIGENGWPSAALGDAFDQAERLHTFVEIAVPHRGSVDVAPTLVEGWGQFSQKLNGGRRSLQAILLSMVALYELVPSYQYCCARGKNGGMANEEVPALDEEFWAEFVLGFGLNPCPYPDCALRRKLLSIGLANRSKIDEIVDAGLPDSVKANHVVVGRLVKGTRETIYVGYNADGDADAITYRTGDNGDGTVLESSVVMNGDKAYAHREKHPFIIGSNEIHRYIYNVLINPIRRVLPPVSAKKEILPFASGAIKSVSLNTTPQIANPGSLLHLNLDISSTDAESFSAATEDNGNVSFDLVLYDGQQNVLEVAGVRDDRSSPYRILITADTTVPDTPGVYRVRALSSDVVLAEDLLYVLGE